MILTSSNQPQLIKQLVGFSLSRLDTEESKVDLIEKYREAFLKAVPFIGVPRVSHYMSE